MRGAEALKLHEPKKLRSFATHDPAAEQLDRQQWLIETYPDRFVMYSENAHAIARPLLEEIEDAIAREELTSEKRIGFVDELHHVRDELKLFQKTAGRVPHIQEAYSSLMSKNDAAITIIDNAMQWLKGKKLPSTQFTSLVERMDEIQRLKTELPRATTSDIPEAEPTLPINPFLKKNMTLHPERKLGAVKTPVEQPRKKRLAEMSLEAFQKALAREIELADLIVDETEDTFARSMMTKKSAEEYRNDLVNALAKLRPLLAMPNMNPQLTKDNEEALEHITDGEKTVKDIERTMKQLNRSFPLDAEAAA